jgi:probable phosphoglycerate mutase
VKARLRFVRHGDASTACPGDTDPGLSIRGIRQALDLPAAIAERAEQLVSSPLIRARETALPLAAAFSLERRIEADYGEIPWREGQTVLQRVEELDQVRGARWSEIDAQWRDWRARLIDRVFSETGDVIVVSHFVAINVLVGLATGDDRMLITRPANTSVTEFTLSAAGKFEVVSLGAQIVVSPQPVNISPTEGFSS